MSLFCGTFTLLQFLLGNTAQDPTLSLMLITCMFINKHTLINMYETKKGILNIPNDPFIIYLAARGTAFPLLAGKESKER